MNLSSSIRSFLQEGTPDSLARLIFFIVGIITAISFISAVLFSMWTHHFTPQHVYDLPRNLSDGLRDIFVAAGAGKVLQRIYGEPAANPQQP